MAFFERLRSLLTSRLPSPLEMAALQTFELSKLAKLVFTAPGAAGNPAATGAGGYNASAYYANAAGMVAGSFISSFFYQMLFFGGLCAVYV